MVSARKGGTCRAHHHITPAAHLHSTQSSTARHSMVWRKAQRGEERQAGSRGAGVPQGCTVWGQAPAGMTRPPACAALGAHEVSRQAAGTPGHTHRHQTAGQRHCPQPCQRNHGNCSEPGPTLACGAISAVMCTTCMRRWSCTPAAPSPAGGATGSGAERGGSSQNALPGVGQLTPASSCCFRSLAPAAGKEKAGAGRGKRLAKGCLQR